MNYKNLSIGKKISINVASAAVALLVLLALAMNHMGNIKSSAELTRDESAKFTLLAKEAELHVVQTQQWLTDISATRGLEGFDDGFSEAEKHAQAFQKIIVTFREMFVKENDTEMISAIDTLSSTYQDFYRIGKEMASIYVKEGPEAGNVYMEKFDPYAKALAGQVTQLVEGQVSELNSSMNSIVNYTAQLFRFIVIAVCVVLILNVLFGYFLASGITKPLKECISIAHDIANSDGDLTKKLKLDRKDEIGVLADTFDSMISNFCVIINSIKEQTSQVAAASEELAATSAQLSSGAEELTSQSATSASSTEEISASIQSISSTSEKMALDAQSFSSEAENMSSNINSVASAIEEMSASVREVAENCSRASSLSVQALDKTNVSQQRIGELDKSAQEIGKVVEVITEITEQTKLLALNATIEAARAGEAGKGFAVVASEVKELAKQTSKATEGIALQIKQIQERTSDVVEVIEEVAGINQSMKDVTNTIAAAVEEQSATTDDMAQTVTATAGEASAVKEHMICLSKDISQNITAVLQEASTGASEISNSTHRVNSIAKDFDHGSSAINSAAGELAGHAGKLQSLVAKFKVC